MKRSENLALGGPEIGLTAGYRDNMRVEVETGVAVTASTVADLRALPSWPDGLVLNIHVDLDPRFSIVRVERAS